MPTNKSLTRITTAALFLSIALAAGHAQPPPDPSDAKPDAKQLQIQRIAAEVHKQIVSLPQYGVFDDISFGIKGSTVILSGKASRPSLKSSIENVVKKIEGVSTVENRIDVLPLSPNDDRVRAGVYFAIYRFPSLQRYSSNRGARLGPSVARRAGGITNDPPIGYHAIHIIVENGNVTLTGVVDSEGDLGLAEMRANFVPGVFSVQNQLQIPGKGN
jgi:hyperosmotically inducible periplasmic protein